MAAASNFDNSNLPHINDRLYELMNRTNYAIVQYNGQRISTSPRAANTLPQRGCEVFVGRIPRNSFEDELLPIFERMGPVYQLRLMMDFTGKNRGFAFVSYFKREVANMAVSLLNGYEMRPGAYIGVYKSVDNCRLFVGGLPQDKTREEIYNELSQFCDGIKEIIMYSSQSQKTVNRGYVFIEFMDHRSAAMARRKLSPGSLILWGVPILVDWADPIPDVDPIIMSKVTKLYIRNLDLNATNDELMVELHNVLPSLKITRVKKIMDYAFVHFANRSAAETALETLNSIEMFGNKIEVTWARPRIFSKYLRNCTPPTNLCTSLPPRLRRQVHMMRDLMQSDSHSSSRSTNLSPNGNIFMNNYRNNNVNDFNPQCYGKSCTSCFSYL